LEKNFFLKKFLKNLLIFNFYLLKINRFFILKII
jgi:hypothetical protein